MGRLHEIPDYHDPDDPGAVLIRSPEHGEVWVTFSGRLHTALLAEESVRPNPRPVLFSGEVRKLQGRSPAMIKAAIDVLKTFPGSRIVR